MRSSKILPLEAAARAIGRRRRRGERVVFTNGCFDLVHAGHARYLNRARALGDVLVIGLNTDASVRRLKGPSRPIVRQRHRAQMLAALGCVDYVVFFPDPTPERLIRALKPDVLVKGADWKADEIAGGRFVRSYGGRVTTVPLVRGLSTSEIIRRIKKS